MAFTKSFMALLAVIGAANAFTGTAFRNSPAEGIVACSATTCPNSQGLNVALPPDTPNGQPACCSVVHISFQGTNFDAVYTATCTACTGSTNISLNDAAFNLLSSGPGPISPVVWNL